MCCNNIRGAMPREHAQYKGMTAWDADHTLADTMDITSTITTSMMMMMMQRLLQFG